MAVAVDVTNEAQVESAIEKVVAYYKTAGRLALKGMGCTGKVWTRGYDKRFCFDRASLRRRIEYVQSQNPA